MRVSLCYQRRRYGEVTDDLANYGRSTDGVESVDEVQFHDNVILCSGVWGGVLTDVMDRDLTAVPHTIAQLNGLQFRGQG